ncbi:MAG TPA: hypothetical protein VNE17_05790 [Nitrolancea sp.]|nr:hypothetical protein [Nitrolancea sp.]
MAWPQNGRNLVSVEQAPGVIETVGNAFVLLNKKPYLLIPPVLLDLFLWLGVRLSLKPLTDTLIRWLGSSSSVDASSIDRIRNAGTSFNLFELLAISMPTFVARVGADAIAGASSWTIDSLAWWLMLPLSIMLFLAGIAIGVSYLTLLGFLVRNERLATWPVLRATAQNVLRTYGYLLLLLGLVLLILFPLLMLSGVLLAFGISIVGLLTLGLVFAAMWAYVMLFFAQDAIVISNAGPARAIYLSYNVVRSNFWPCIGLIVVSMTLQIGTPLALVAFTRTPWAVPLAFIAHAYILTGVAVATMLFYRDRAMKLRASRLPAAPDRTS